ncbi:hypothetical protein BH10PSE5_BH10PSE5_16440 [soil metagenome]
MADKSGVVIALDAFQTELGALLKPLGFRRKGRAFNRQTETGVVQVIALQAGPHEIGPPLPASVASLRPNLYGKFTINLGVYVEEVFARTNPDHLPRGAISDAHCSIRTRLSHIMSGEDVWWPLPTPCDLSQELTAAVLNKGLSFLDQFSSRDQIVEGWVRFNENELLITRVARLDVAMILLRNGDREGARDLFQDHLAQADGPANHVEYVRELAIRLGLG